MPNSASSSSTDHDCSQWEAKETLARVALVYCIAGLLAVASVTLPELTDDPTRHRVIYSIWVATALLIPTVSFFFFADLSCRARVYWSLFHTSAYLVYMIHFVVATYVHFGGFRQTLAGQGTWIGWFSFLLTLVWTVDVVLVWTATARDYRVWSRHLVVLLFLVGAFLFFTIIRAEGVVRWLGICLAVAFVVAAAGRWRFRQLLGGRLSAESSLPQERYFRGSLEAEAAYFERFIRQINEVQRRIRDKNYPSPARRAFHAKQLLGVSNARFEVCQDIPEEFRVGLFAESKAYQASVRLSNAAGKIQPDSAKDLRGLALRVHLDAENAHDFLGTNAPASHARDANQFMAVAVAASKRPRVLFPLRLLLAVGPDEMIRILWVVLGSRSTVASVAAETYWSRSAIRVGGTAVRYSFVPGNAPLSSIRAESPDFLREELARQLDQGAIAFDLMFQRFVNEKLTPVEDSSVGWDESVSPPIKVAELTIPQQALNTADSNRREAAVNSLDFNPWRTSDDLKPLGSQNRARQMVYKASSGFRRRRKEVEIRPLLVSIPIRVLTPVFRILNLVVPLYRWPLEILEVINLDTFRHLLRERNLHDPAPPPLLQASTSIREFDSNKTTSRQSDGTYNDLTDTDMGRAGSVFGRNVPLTKLTVPTPQSVLDPNPRRISRELHARDSFVPATTLNVTAAAWIQFQVHGWFNHTKLKSVFRTDQCWEVRLSPDDPWNQYEQGVMRIPKTPVHGRTKNSVSTFTNTESHWWDASQVYGNSEGETRLLRDDHSGYMRMEGDLLPVDPRIPSHLGEFDLTGFNDNYWLGLSLMHTLFVREHNAICDRLIDEFPSRKGDDE